MRTKLFSFSLFFLSFAPLWISVLFIDIKSCVENNDYLWTERLGIGLIMFFAIVCFFIVKAGLKTNTKGATFQRLKCAKEEKTITAEYLLSYILPLFAFNFRLWNEVVLFLIFFFTLGYLCIRHNHFSVNIVLEMSGYRIYDCSFVNEDGIQTDCSVISRRKVNGYIGETISVKPLNNEYKLDVFK
ncbi:MAG: hypothetical protein PHX08_03440 [Lachnospiraceae bacterium]|nr:hypothetical protein [Lachnospiraceae bacterium]